MVRQPLGLGLACLVMLGHSMLENREWVGAAVSLNWDAVTQLMESDNRQGAVRVELWIQALAIGSRSPIVGLGAGSHLPADRPDSPLEAHNTVLDLFLVSGVIGLLPLVALCGVALWGARQNGHLAIVLLMGVAISSFAQFHFVGRQPLFWITVFAIMYCGAPDVLTRKSATSQTHGA